MSGSTRKREKAKMAANSGRENFADGTDERSHLIKTSVDDDELIERPRGRYNILELIAKIVVALICGFLFGVALEKGRGKSGTQLLPFLSLKFIDPSRQITGILYLSQKYG